MKKHNTTTTAKKQARQLASKARRKRRVTARKALVEIQVKRRIKPLTELIKNHEKTIENLEAKLKTPAGD